jgi:phosphoribosylaminoimidazolecarboxamide formyltransferase / IMP cyclohydrolase
MKRALLSVSDKTGLVDFARALHELNWEIISTGGTATVLREAGIPAIQVSTVTGFPEIMDGRVKTLHPKVHGGILADRSIPGHIDAAETHGIILIDLVAVNLYPFEKTVRRPDATRKEIIENIDIGGPSMVRSAAKNHRHMTVVVDPADYKKVIDALHESGKTSIDLRAELAAKAFAHTARYDAMIAGTLSEWIGDQFNDELSLGFRRDQLLRYGENPHQAGAFYQNPDDALFEQLHGLQLSYNNYLDLDAALKLLVKYDELGDDKTTVGILKHTNPCGVGRAETVTVAYRAALACDTASPYGGIVAVNRILDLEAANAINEVFTEIIIAPEYTPEAFAKLTKKKNRRLLRYFPQKLGSLARSPYFVRLLNGMLIQDPDIGRDDEAQWRVVTERKPSETEFAALRFAWKTVALLKSNAVCFTTHDRTIGLGIGQTSRIDSTEIAVRKAGKFGHDLAGTACASDGFFPFRDSVDEMVRLGVIAVIQPGGSTGDAEVIAACDEQGVTMIFTGMRHFRH